MNKVVLMGRLTRDPEVRYSRSETPMAITRYTLAVKNYSKNNEQNTDFIDIIAFNKQGEFAEKYLKKGNMVVVSGRLHQEKWEDEEKGRHSKIEVVVDEQQFAGYSRNHKEGEVQQNAESQIAAAETIEAADGVDNLPY